jgi:hypothetical protein
LALHLEVVARAGKSPGRRSGQFAVDQELIDSENVGCGELASGL